MKEREKRKKVREFIYLCICKHACAFIYTYIVRSAWYIWSHWHTVSYLLALQTPCVVWLTRIYTYRYICVTRLYIQIYLCDTPIHTDISVWHAYTYRYICVIDTYLCDMTHLPQGKDPSESCHMWAGCHVTRRIAIAYVSRSHVAHMNGSCHADKGLADLSVMGWLRLVGSLKLLVSFAKEPYKRDLYSPERRIILRSLLIVATPYA